MVIIMIIMMTMAIIMILFDPCHVPARTHAIVRSCKFQISSTPNSSTMLSVGKLHFKNVLCCKLHVQDSWNSEIYWTKTFSGVAHSRPLSVSLLVGIWNAAWCWLINLNSD